MKDKKFLHGWWILPVFLVELCLLLICIILEGGVR